MKQKLGLLVTAGALSALLLVGGTLAWFTDTEAATNTFEMGNVAIDLLENGSAIQGESEEFPNGFAGLQFNNLVPGDEVDKLVEVRNTGSVDAYVRIKLTSNFDQDIATEEDLDLLTLLDLNTGTAGMWEKVGDYFYYKGKLAPNALSDELLSEVSLPTSLGNEYANSSFSILIQVEAIQAEHIYEAPASGPFSAADLAAAWTLATN
jgi:predicted ribosomally synthesized peptide with SipW-like signal peptide